MEFTFPATGLGDLLCTTPVLRELKKRLPEENLRLFEPLRRDVWLHNPYLNKGNHENGLRMRLMPLGQGDRIAESYASRISDTLRMEPRLTVADDTPELFFTAAELSETFDVRSDKAVAINADASWTTRRWPYFHELAELLLARGWSVYHVGHDGTPPLPCTKSFHGKLSMRRTALLLKQIGRIACNDTGLLHLAAAVGAAQIVPFGYIQGPSRAYATTRIVDHPVPCGRRCLYYQCTRSVRCAELDNVSVRTVFAEVVR